jgi:DNA mismatch repair ATPase MutS
MNHIEAQILDLVAKLYPQVFAGLAGYYQRHRDFFDPVVASFDRELQFYISFLEFIDPLKGAGLSFCHPRVSADSKELLARESFDLALADVLVSEGSTIICNDFELRDAERIIVVSGPNQGGKTTFARMFGQLHHLASLGCLVPGSSARLFLFDEIFTHFEREEELTRLSGKLEDDLLRIHEILEKATSESVVIMNESLTSTTLSDALLLSRAIMEQMIERGLLGVYVTFIDELATLGPATVSMVSTVEPDDPAKRTFKVLRRPADGRAYALAIAEKHGLTARRIRERIGR